MFRHRIRLPRLLALAVVSLPITMVAPPADAQLQFTNYSTGGPPATTLNFPDVEVSDIFFSQGICYVASSSNGLYISSDNGDTWENFTTAQGLPTDSLSCVFVDDDGTIYVGADESLSVSTDLGLGWNTFTTAADGFAPGTVRSICVDGGTIYAASAYFVSGSALDIGGLSVSANGGKSWTVIDSADGLPNNLVTGVSVLDGNILVTTSRTGNTVGNYGDPGGFSISSDNGQTWVNNTEVNGPGTCATGLTVQDGVIYVNSVSSGNLFNGGGVSISSDNGVTWTYFSNAEMGLPSSVSPIGDPVVIGDWLYVSFDEGYGIGYLPLSTSCDSAAWSFWTAADLAMPSVELCGESVQLGVSLIAAADSQLICSTGFTVESGSCIESAFGLASIDPSMRPGIAGDAVIDVDVRHGVICVATDSGVSTSFGPISGGDSINWNNATTSNGLGSDTVNAVQVGEDFVVAATNGGVSISTDGGICWTNATTADGLANDQVFSVYLHDGDIYAATGGGLSISTDQGASWTSPRAILGLPTQDVYVAPSVYQGQPVDVIYVTVYDGYPRASFDGGKTFVELTNQCGEYPSPLASPSIAAQGGAIYVFGSPDSLVANVLQSQACDPSCDYECGWSYVSPWCGYVSDFEIVGPDRWIATPAAGGEEGGLVFNPTGATKSTCPTATQIYTTANGLGNNSVNAVSVGDGLVVAGTTNGVSIAVLGACPGDLDLDGDVDGRDLGRLLALIGTDCGGEAETCLADLDGSGVIDAGDVATFFTAWGSCG